MDTQRLFVGRENDLKTLVEMAKQAFSSKCTIIGISGRAGVGKSSLVNSFLQAVNNIEKPEILIGRCVDSEAMPFLPFTEALRKYFRISGIDQPATIERLKEAFSTVGKDLVNLIPLVGPFLTVGISLVDYVNKNFSSAPKEIEQSKLFYAVTQILLSLGKKHKIILIIEDIHLADKSTLNLFQYIARECAGIPLLVIVTFRSFDSFQAENNFLSVWRNLLQHELVKEIKLSDFNYDEMKIYFGKIFDNAEVDAKLTDILYKQTHGNPFYLSQILPVLLQESVLLQDHGKWIVRESDFSLNLPSTVEAAVEDVLHTLAPHELETLETASAIGDIFEYRILASVSTFPADQIDEQIDVLDDKRIITEIPEILDAYTFVHSIIRNVIYQKLSSRERRRLHLKIAQTIEQIYHLDVAPVVEKLSYHYDQARDSEKTIEYSLMAAKKAEIVLAYDEVLRFCQKALGHMKVTDPGFATTLLYAGEIADYSSQWTLAREFFEKLYSVSKSQPSEKGVMQATRGLSAIDFREGKWESAEQLSVEHLRIAEKLEDHFEKSIGLFNLGQVYWRTGRWKQAEDTLIEALAIQEQNCWFERVLQTIAILGVVLRNQDKYDDALETYKKGVEIHGREKVNDQYWLAIIYNNMGTTLRSIAAEEDLQLVEESSYWQKSVVAYEKSLSITTKLKSYRDIGNTCNNLAIIYKSRKLNDLNRAMEFAQKAKENLVHINAPVDLLDNLRITGSIFSQSAQYPMATSCLEESLSIAQSLKAKDKIGLANMEMGMVHHRLGDTISAKYYYDQALNVFLELGAPKRISYVHMLQELARDNLDAPISTPE